MEYSGWQAEHIFKRNLKEIKKENSIFQGKQQQQNPRDPIEHVTFAVSRVKKAC